MKSRSTDTKPRRVKSLHDVDIFASSDDLDHSRNVNGGGSGDDGIDPISVGNVMSSTVSDGFASSLAGGILPHPQLRQRQRSAAAPNSNKRSNSKIFDDAAAIAGYDSVPLIDIDLLPRGGISFETKAVGRIQFGIPPETIKDSMNLGMEVPSVYIVPMERFCRALGPALGLNLAEFEFPAYFNYFVRGKKVQLIVESTDAENEIRTVFGETLLGPEHFRDSQNPCANVDEDFDPRFPRDRRPDFYKEFEHFRTAEKNDKYPELCIDTLLDFIHFSRDRAADYKTTLGVPPSLPEFETVPENAQVGSGATDDEIDMNDAPCPPPGGLARASTTAGRMLLKTATGAISADNTSKTEDVFSDSKMSPQIPVASLKRRNSDESLSSNNSHSSDPQQRRGSVGRPEDSSEHSLLLSPVRQNRIGALNSLISGDSESADDLHGSRYSRISRISTGSAANMLGYEFMEEGDDLRQRHWMYSQAKWLGELAVVYPPHIKTESERKAKCARVEIFKMAGGTEYIVHDIDDNNIIIGKTRFSGSVRTPDELSIQGFLSSIDDMSSLILTGQDDECSTILDQDGDKDGAKIAMSSRIAPTPKFFPPTFGVTVLGNSHGFDKNGATSGYVLWVNGRGIMIDPPPFSSSTLESEGIRPQMITAIIITHCHADHDAGAFQKIMTGSRVAIITTPTIYKSFLRKYSALSGLKQKLLRHSHRYRPAIIGQPLRFQGAVFHFSYTLHTIPCISFKVEWRERSIVFTGDHMNIPEQIEKLERQGTLSKGRADDLRKLPMQDCDVLLHEAGVPPIHTPVSVLQALPSHVKDRLYVVHTAAVPVESGLRLAPTGTAGTLRLFAMDKKPKRLGSTVSETKSIIDPSTLQDGSNQNLTIHGKVDPSIPQSMSDQLSREKGEGSIAPLVFLRPADTSDAWFILNLLAAVPFLSSLSYGHTMEILEIANVQVFCDGDVVISGSRRPDFLVVIWEGTCMECRHGCNDDIDHAPVIWHAGDWMGPLSLQPDVSRSSISDPSNQPRDIFAVSKEGTKAIFLPMKDVSRILKNGSGLFRKYMALEVEQKKHHGEKLKKDSGQLVGNQIQSICDNDKLLNVLQCNSVLGSLYATQKRHLESLAEGPTFFSYNEVLWKVGDPVTHAYVIVSGTVTFGRATTPATHDGHNVGRRGSTGAILGSIAERGTDQQQKTILLPPSSLVEADKILKKVSVDSEYSRLESLLQIRAEDMEDLSMQVEPDDSSTQQVVSAYRDRFANKILRKLYSRHAYTENIVFSRGNLLCDFSRLVSGDLAKNSCDSEPANDTPSRSHSRSSIGSLLGDHHCHTSNLIAGPNGCLVMAFPRGALVSFLDNNPGVLLSLLGTQAVV